MEIDALRNGLMDCLEQFDTEILPLGLYASDDLIEGRVTKPRYQEWKGAIFPFLVTRGCKTSGFHPRGISSSAVCDVPAIGSVNITLVKISNIKVRKYGSGYQVDKQEDRSGRWESADLSGQISQMWKQPYDWSGISKTKAQIVLFVGFDKTQRPFERELDELSASIKWGTSQSAIRRKLGKTKPDAVSAFACARGRVRQIRNLTVRPSAPPSRGGVGRVRR